MKLVSIKRFKRKMYEIDAKRLEQVKSRIRDFIQ
jgi:hypothetical protein